MNSKIKLLLGSLVVASSALVADVVVEPVQEEVDSEELVEIKGTRHYEKLKVNVLRVFNEEVDGALTVNGSLTTPNIGLVPPVAAGTVGVPGIGGDLAYGAVGSLLTQTVAVSSPVTFNVVPSFTNSGVTPISTNGNVTATGLTVAETGIYRITAYILGSPTIGSAAPLYFQLQANGAPIQYSGTFQSASSVAPATYASISGAGIIPLTAGTALTLVNVGAEPVFFPLDAAPNGSGQAAINAVMAVERIA